MCPPGGPDQNCLSRFRLFLAPPWSLIRPGSFPPPPEGRGTLAVQSRSWPPPKRAAQVIPLWGNATWDLSIRPVWPRRGVRVNRVTRISPYISNLRASVPWARGRCITAPGKAVQLVFSLAPPNAALVVCFMTLATWFLLHGSARALMRLRVGALKTVTSERCCGKPRLPLVYWLSCVGHDANSVSPGFFQLLQKL